MRTRPKSVTDEEMAMAIGRRRGNLSAAADDLKISRQAIYYRLKQSPELQAALEQTRETVLDQLEDRLIEEALSGRNTAALLFALKTRGYKRGYQEVRKVQMDADVRTTDEAKKQDEKWERWNELLAQWAAAEKDDEGEDE